MPDNPVVVALLKKYRGWGTATRTELARVLGVTRNKIAGICSRNSIAPWPKLSQETLARRGCQFPIGIPDDEGFCRCGKRRAPGHSFLCDKHERKTWPLKEEPKPPGDM